MNADVNSRQLRPLFIVLLLISCMSPLYGQSMWTVGQTPDEVSIEYLPVQLKKGFLLTDFTGYALYVNSRFSVGERMTIMLSLPYAYGHLPAYPSIYNVPEQRHSTIGNVYIGMEFLSEKIGMTTNVGVFLPSVNKNKTMALFAGFLSDIERTESFYSDFVTIAVLTRKDLTTESGFGLRLNAAISGSVRTSSDRFGGNPIEGMLAYAAQPTFTVGAFQVLAGISGRMDISSGGDISRRTFHQVGVTGAFTYDRIRIGAYYRVPVDDFPKSIITSSIGGSVTLIL